jgi:hypothetical protein
LTGYSGRDASFAELWTWGEDRSTGNIALRMPAPFEADGQFWQVIALDVDHYEKAGHQKTGADTVAKWEAEAGQQFPPTYRVTSRDPQNPSGKRLYRVPAGTRLISAAEDCELIQRHHRYVVASPSRNGDDSGSVVRTYDDRTGVDVAKFPTPAEVPILPAALIDVLRERQTPGNALQLAPGQAADFVAAWESSDPCKSTRGELSRALAACMGGSRHDAVRDRVLALLRQGHMGHRGVAIALERLREAFVAAVAPSRSGGSKAADDEFTRMVTGERGMGLILASPTAQASRGCKCPAEIPEAVIREWMTCKDITADELDMLEELSDHETFARVRAQMSAGAPRREAGGPMTSTNDQRAGFDDSLDLSDASNGQHLVNYFGDQFARVTDEGTVRVWRGTHWEADEAGDYLRELMIAFTEKLRARARLLALVAARKLDTAGDDTDAKAKARDQSG